MGKPGLICVIVAVVTMSACSSANRASTDPTISAPASAVRVTTTTVHPQSTTTTSTPDFSFDNSVPPPKLVNTGKNYVAILKSLEAYGNWLAAHRPDPTLVSKTIADGTKLHELFGRDLERLRANHKRKVEVLGAASRYTILSATPGAFSAQVIEDVRTHRVVVSSGKVTSEVRFTKLTTYRVLVVVVAERWHVAAFDVQQPVNVHL